MIPTIDFSHISPMHRQPSVIFYYIYVLHLCIQIKIDRFYSNAKYERDLKTKSTKMYVLNIKTSVSVSLRHDFDKITQ